MNALHWLILPVFVHVALVIIVGLVMARERYKIIAGGAVKLADFRAGQARWPGRLRQLTENYANQFELPVLFYAVVALIVATGTSDMVQAVLASGFAASRIVHTLIHTGANVIRQRMLAFMAGVAIICAMWIWFALRLFVIG